MYKDPLRGLTPYSSSSSIPFRGGGSLSYAVIDFETRSTCDLRKHGAWRYSKDPTTEVVFLGYRINDEPRKLWHAKIGEQREDETPIDLMRHIARGGLLVAQNYFFEKCHWVHIMQSKYGWIPVPHESWRCTAALCARNNLPRGLDAAGKALRLTTQKDDVGHRLMLSMCKPCKVTEKNPTGWRESLEDLERLGGYCLQDVDAEKAIWNVLPPLEPRELALWQFTEELNWKGVLLDLDFAQRATDIFSTLKQEGQKRVAVLTDGAVTTLGQTARIVEWCRTRNISFDNLQKATVAEVLAGELDPSVREVLELRSSLAKGASISKYQAMLDRADLEDCRLRDHVNYFGAGPGRWSGKGVQTQNLPNKLDLTRARRIIDVTKNLHYPKAARLLYDNPTQELSSCIRPTFRAAPGHVFVCADYSAIEARVLAWLAGDHNLEVFRQGKDIYIEMASKIYGRTITKADKTERGLGKEAELACGYQLWWKTLLTRCWGKGVKVDPLLALKTVKLYRNEHPKIVEFWHDINAAFIECILYRRDTFVGCLRFSLFKNTIRMYFPSGRYIVYYYPSVKRKRKKPQETDEFRTQLKQLGVNPLMIEEACEMHLEEAKSLEDARVRQVACYYRESSTNWKWMETSTYGGKLTENACQGVAGDILSGASLLLNADKEKFGRAVMTVHDELVLEQLLAAADLEATMGTMCILPWWAKGLPLSAEGWVGKEYRKDAG